MKTQTTTLTIVLALLALTTFAAPAQAFSAQARFQADMEQTLLESNDPAGSGGSCSLLNLVCAYARASAFAYNCYDADVNVVFPCWYAYGGGTAGGNLGAVAGTLSGYANGVPLADNCFASEVGQYDACAMNTYLDRYPGTVVQVTVTVTATAAYGAADDTDVDFDSA